MVRFRVLSVVLLLVVAAQAASLSVASAHEVKVAMLNESFNPAEVVAEPLDPVTFVNEDREPHTATADACVTQHDNCPFDIYLDSGQSMGAGLPQGTYPFFCRLHGAPGGQGMAGVLYVGTQPGGGATQPGVDPVTRLAGEDRIATAVAASRAAFPTAASAGAAVLSRADVFADALAGTPLAIANKGPLLLTSTSQLDPRVEGELRRVLPPGRTVHLLGSEGALGAAVASRVQALGFAVVRHAGVDRFETAVRVAESLGAPGHLLIASGVTFPDALAAGVAAGKAGGAVLLTAGDTLPAATIAYVSNRPGIPRSAIGGPAAAADPAARPIVGADRYDTARAVAEAFFSGPPAVGVASGVNWPDALGGGAHVGALGGPLLLTDPGAVPAGVRAYLEANRASIGSAAVYGGQAAVGDTVVTAVEQAIR